MHQMTGYSLYARLHSMTVAELTRYVADCEVALAHANGNNLHNWQNIALAQDELLERLRKCVSAYGERSCTSEEIPGNPA